MSEIPIINPYSNDPKYYTTDNDNDTSSPSQSTDDVNTQNISTQSQNSQPSIQINTRKRRHSTPDHRIPNLQSFLTKDLGVDEHIHIYTDKNNKPLALKTSLGFPPPPEWEDVTPGLFDNVMDIEKLVKETPQIVTPDTKISIVVWNLLFSELLKNKMLFYYLYDENCSKLVVDYLATQIYQGLHLIPQMLCCENRGTVFEDVLAKKLNIVANNNNTNKLQPSTKSNDENFEKEGIEEIEPPTLEGCANAAAKTFASFNRHKELEKSHLNSLRRAAKIRQIIPVNPNKQTESFNILTNSGIRSEIQTLNDSVKKLTNICNVCSKQCLSMEYSVKTLEYEFKMFSESTKSNVKTALQNLENSNKIVMEKLEDGIINVFSEIQKKMDYKIEEVKYDFEGLLKTTNDYMKKNAMDNKSFSKSVEDFLADSEKNLARQSDLILKELLLVNRNFLGNQKNDNRHVDNDTNNSTDTADTDSENNNNKGSKETKDSDEISE